MLDDLALTRLNNTMLEIKALLSAQLALMLASEARENGVGKPGDETYADALRKCQTAIDIAAGKY